MSSNANAKRRRLLAEDADIRPNKRRKPDKVDKPENAMKIQKDMRSEKTTAPSSKASPNALLTPVSMKTTEVAKGNGNGRAYRNQDCNSDYDPIVVNLAYASSMISIGTPSEKYGGPNNYAVTTLDESKGCSPTESYESYYLEAPTEPNSIAEWVDPDPRIPTHREFAAAIRRKCVGMSDRDRSKEREQRKEREWARNDISRK